MGVRLLRITTVPESLHVLLRGQLQFMQNHGFQVLAVSSNGRHVRDIEASGIPYRKVNLTRKVTPIIDLLALVQLIYIIIRFKPHIVHTHTPKAGLLGMIASWLCRIPVRLHTVAGLPLMESRGIKFELLRLTEHITYACAGKVFVNSTGLLEYVKQNFYRHNKKLHILAKGSSNGIDVDFFSRTREVERMAVELRKIKSISEKNYVFGFVGRIVKDKGIHELVVAFRKLHERYPYIRLLLVGKFEPELDPVDEEIHNYLSAAKEVFLAGYQDDVRPWFAMMDTFVFPSYREGFPNVVMQAACMQVPCIVSDINGCNELVSHRTSGLIVPPKNTEALMLAMEEMLNYDERYIYGQKAREWVVKHFDQRVIWHALLDEYQRLLKKHGVQGIH
ncbi:MAG: glycosyltransferase family 4 protein [Chitinophagaceae bacterium]|nr:glycosyltransferase family 4 protein [Chitinophagaceae bacterium]